MDIDYENSFITFKSLPSRKSFKPLYEKFLDRVFFCCDIVAVVTNSLDIFLLHESLRSPFPKEHSIRAFTLYQDVGHRSEKYV